MKKERWLPVVGYENFYEVSDHGRVRRIGYRAGLKKPRANKNGYLFIRLKVNGAIVERFVHVMVLEAFRGLRPANTGTRHLDGKRDRNNLTNLRWGTAKENAADALRHGTTVRGARHSKSFFTDNDVLSIRADFAAGMTRRQIAETRNVNYKTIVSIVARENWKHLP